MSARLAVVRGGLAVDIRLRLIPIVALLGVFLFLVGSGSGIRASAPRAVTARAARDPSCPVTSPASPTVAAWLAGLSTPATPPPVPAAVPLGRPTAFGSLTLTATGVARLDCVVGPQNLLPRGVFLAVALRVVATGPVGGEGEFPVADLRVVDRRGEAIPPALDATAALSHQRGLPIPMLAPLLPGVPTSLVVVFDVPRDATGLVLTSVDAEFAVRLAAPAVGEPGA
jgi:hypothetical protein